MALTTRSASKVRRLLHVVGGCLLLLGTSASAAPPKRDQVEMAWQSRDEAREHAE